MVFLCCWGERLPSQWCCKVKNWQWFAWKLLFSLPGVLMKVRQFIISYINPLSFISLVIWAKQLHRGRQWCQQNTTLTISPLPVRWKKEKHKEVSLNVCKHLRCEQDPVECSVNCGYGMGICSLLHGFAEAERAAKIELLLTGGSVAIGSPFCACFAWSHRRKEESEQRQTKTW